MKNKFTICAALLGSVTLACLSNAGLAATIGICEASIEIRADMRAQEFYSATGERQLLIVSDSSLDTALCESTSLPQTADSILWSALLPSSDIISPQTQLILQGSFAADRAQISEIITTEPAQPAMQESRQPSEATEELADEFEHVLFGVEERAQWLGGNQLDCASGTQAAGIQLISNYQWPQNTFVQINASGIGEFRVAIADEQNIANESTVSLGSIQLSGNANDISRSFALPDTRSEWKAITLTCPQGAGIISIDAIALRPVIINDSERSRSAWIWNPSTWLNQADFFWTVQGLEDIGEFYVTVPVNEAGEVNNPQELSAFIKAASARDIKIWAVIGDRHDVLPETQSLLRTRVAAYRRYNTRVAVNEQLAGVQLDIEPYLLPGNTLAKDLWRDRYLQTISAAKQSAGESLHIDLVMPVWWGVHANWGPKLLDALTLPGISLTIMNYRTDYEQLLTGMTPFLEWGVRNGQAVRVALETGSLSDETQRAYVRNTQGELWQLQIGTTPILVLFAEAQQNLPGVALSQRFERVFSADKLTFSGDQLRLNDISNRLSEELDNWASFAGIALHGLDEVYADQL